MGILHCFRVVEAGCDSTRKPSPHNSIVEYSEKNRKPALPENAPFAGRARGNIAANALAALPWRKYC